MEPVEAKRFCDAFTGELRKLGVRVREGVFRAHMLVSIENDGPVTILMDSKKLF
jgi:D-tyrosyl-tRNA(Tyr) deacylase